MAARSGKFSALVLATILLLPMLAVGVAAGAPSSPPPSSPSAPHRAFVAPSLQALAKRADGMDLLPVTIVLSKPLEKPNTEDRAEAARARAASAESHQSSLVAFLNREAARGRVADVTSLWTVNAVSAKVAPAVLKIIERRDDVEAVWKAGDARVNMEGHNPLRAEIIRHLSEDLGNPLFDAEDHARLAALYRSTPPDLERVDVLDPDWAQEWIAADLLMDRTSTGAGSTLAVLDSGVWGGHPELDHAIVDFVDFTRRSSDRAAGQWAYHAHPAVDQVSFEIPVDLADATVASFAFRSFHDFPTCYYSPGSPYEQYCDHGSLVVNDPGVGEVYVHLVRDRADGPSTVTVDLTPWAGRSVTLDFRVAASPWNDGYDGWFVDDLALVVDGAAVWLDDAETGETRATSSSGWTRWTRATYDAPMLSAGNARGPAVATSPTFDLTGADGPFAANVTWFNDAPSYAHVNLWASDDLGATWQFVHTFSAHTHEDLDSGIFELPETLIEATSLRFAVASAHGYGSGTLDDEPREWPLDIPGSRGFALARFAIDGLPGSATTDFDGWNGEGGFAVRPIGTVAYDDAGHGTAVAGIIAADGSHRWHRGLAPDAELVVVKVFNREGWAVERDLLDAYAAVSARDGVDILSYSGGSFESTHVSTWSELDDGYVYPARFDFEVGGSPSHPASYLLGYVEMAGPDGSDAWDYEDPHPLVARFVDPSGSTYQGVPVDWVISPGEGTYEDERVWFHKLNPETPLPSGTWSLVGELDPATHPAKRSGDGALWIGDTTAPDWMQTSRLGRSFDLAGLETATLSFWMRYSSGVGSGCGRVIVEEVGGPLTLDTLNPDFEPAGACDDSWYNATSREYEPTGFYQGWSGDGWRPVTLNLTPFAGRTVHVTFEWTYAEWSPAEGWFIDDLSIPELGHEYGFDTDLGDWVALDPGSEAQWRIVSENPFKPGMYAAIAVGYPDDGSSPQSRAIDAVAASGILPVVSAGNNGGRSDCELVWGEECSGLGLRTINTPAAARQAYAVGATAYEHDRVASFSSLGPVGFGDAAYMKPDVVAPGVHVRTTDRYGGSTEESGTSFAAPQVAALAALILEADPARRVGLPGSVTSLINATAVDIGPPGYDAETGWGRIDAFSAVNLTGRLPPLRDGEGATRSLGHELFAGTIGYPTSSTGDTRYMPLDDQPMVVADRGLVDSTVLDLRAAHIAAADETGQTALVEFYLSGAAPNATVTLFLDVDQDETTGQRGAETAIHVSFTPEATVGDVKLESWDGAWNDPGVSIEAVVKQANPLVLSIRQVDGAAISAAQLGAPEGLRTFRAWLEAVLDGVVVDRAPDEGYGLFPTHYREIVASAFSWNQTARAPQPGEPVTFRWEALRAINCTGCAPVVLSEAVAPTNEDGRAEVTLAMTANRTFETHRLVIEDTRGNSVRHGFTPGHRLPPVVNPATTPPQPGWRLGSQSSVETYPSTYYVDRTGSINLSWVIMDRETGAPFEGDAVFQIRNEWYCPYWWCWWYGAVNHKTIASDPITAVDGVVSWIVPYAEMPQPSSTLVYDYWKLEVRGTPVEGDAFVLHPGWAYGAWEDYNSIDVLPYLSSAAPGDTVDIVTILSKQAFDGRMTPHGSAINVTVSWVTERDAAAVFSSLPPDLGASLARALAATSAEASRDALSRADVARLSALHRDGPLGFRNFETRATYSIPATGIGSFPVHVPEGRVLYGWVAVEDVSTCTGGLYPYCDSEESLIVVPSILARSGPHRPSSPPSGSGEPEIDAWIVWDHDPVTLVSADTADVHVSIYDDETSEPVAGVNLWIYGAHGGIRRATTDATGEAVVTIPARALNLTKANFHDRFLDAWVVTDLVETSNGHALARYANSLKWAGLWEWNYFGDVPSPGSSGAGIDILGGFVGDELRATVRWVDETGAPSSNVPSAIQVYKALYGADDSHGGMLHTEHVEAPTGEWPVNVAVPSYGTYALTVVSEPTIRGQAARVFSRTPFAATLPALDTTYPAHASIPLPVVLHDDAGEPIVGAEVWAFVESDDYCWPDLGGDESEEDSLSVGGRPAGHNCIDDADRAYFRAVRGITDESGAVTFTVQAPPRGNLWVDIQIWASDGENLADLFSWSFWTEAGAVLPNLEVSLRALPTVLAVGQQTVFEAVVRNTGSAASPATILRFERDGVLLRDVAVQALSAGGEAVVPLVWSSNETGAFALTATVDPLGAIEEASESDNLATSNVRVTQPNLVSSHVVVPPPRALVGSVDHVNLGTPYTLRATIRNLGEIPAGASTHRILAGTTVLVSATDLGLAPGDAFELEALWTPSELGPVDLVVVSDALGVVPETNEMDNRAVRRVVVSEAPDLVVRAIRAPAAVRIDTPVEFEFKVSNVGGLTTNVPTTLRFTSGTTVIDVLVPAIAPGQNATAVVTTTFAVPGFAAWSAAADALGDVAEFSETNNGASGSVSVRIVNLVVSLLAPGEVWLGANAVLRATVVNDGLWPSTATTLDITDGLLPDGPALAPAATALPIPALGPGRGHTVEVPAWSTAVAGLHRLEAVLPASVDDDASGNAAARDVVAEAAYVRDLCADYQDPVRPAGVDAHVSFRTNVRGTATITATGAGALAATPVTVTREVTQGWNYLTVSVPSVTVGAAVLTVAVALPGASATVVSGESTDTCLLPLLKIRAKPVIVKDSNHTVAEPAASVVTKRVDVWTFDIATLEQEFVVDVKAGAQGRILSGLEYLRFYPNYCVEQTTSPMLAALHVIEYYKARGVYDELGEDAKSNFDQAVRGGVSILTSGHNKQKPSGGWSMYGYYSDATNFYSAFATHGLLSVRSDPKYRELVDGSGVNYTRIPNYFASSQNANGGFSEGAFTWYLRSEVALTALILKDLAHLRPLVTDETARETLDRVALNATRHLLSARDGSAWPDYPGGGGNAFSTAFALWGLQSALDAGILPEGDASLTRSAIGSAVTYLESRQTTSGGWTRDANNANYYTSFLESAVHAETTAIVVLALNATGRGLENAAVTRGVNNLYNVYRDGGSFGNTRTTQAAVHVLALLQRVQTISASVEVFVDDIRVAVVNLTTLAPDCQFRFGASGVPESMTPACDIGFTGDTMTGLLARTQHNVTFNVLHSSVPTLLAAYNRQHADYDEATATVPERYIDPIATTFFLDLAWPAESIQNQATTITANFRNDEPLSIFSPAIAVPLGTTLAAANTADDPPTMRFADGTVSELEFQVVNGILYLLPQYVPEAATTTFSFKVRPLVAGSVGITATGYPLYNDQLMAVASATGTVRGFGAVQVNVVDESGQPFAGATSTLGSTSLGGASATFTDVLEGAKTVTVTAAGRLPVAGTVDVVRGSTTTVTVALVPAASAPRWVYTTAASAGTALVDDATTDETYTRVVRTAISASGGATTVAYTIPAGHALRGVTFAGSAVTPTVANGVALVTLAGVLDGDLVYDLESPDRIAPVITILAPAPDATNVAGTAPLSLTFADFKGVHAPSLAFAVDGTNVTASAVVTASAGLLTAVAWTPSPALARGPHTATVSVADLAGNVAARTWSFTILATGGSTPTPGTPTGTPAPGTRATLALLASGTTTTASFDAARVRSVRLTAGGSDLADVVVDVTPRATLAETGASAAAPGLVLQYLDIMVTSSGQPLAASALEGAAVRFSVPRAWLDSQRLSSAHVSLAHWTGGAWTVLATAVVSEDATTLVFEAATNAFSPFAIVGRDEIAPTIGLLRPNDGETTSSTTVTASYSDDSAIDVSKIRLMLDGVPVNAVAGPNSLTATLTGLSQGAHQLILSVTDVHGNTVTRTSTFTYSPSAPSVSIESPASGSVVESARVAIRATLTGFAGLTNANVRVTIDGNAVPVSVAGGLATGTIDVAEGPHQLVVTATDLSGRASQATSDFRVDLAAPSLAPEFPTGPVSGLVRIPTGASDSAGVDRVEVYVDGDLVQTIRNAPWVAEIDTSLLPDGTHLVSFVVYDRANRSTTRAADLDAANGADEVLGEGRGILGIPGPGMVAWLAALGVAAALLATARSVQRRR